MTSSDAQGLFYNIAVIGARQLAVLCIVCAFLLAVLQVVAPRIWPERPATADTLELRSESGNAEQALDVDLFQKTVTISAIGFGPVFLAAGITIYVFALARSSKLTRGNSVVVASASRKVTPPVGES